MDKSQLAQVEAVWGLDRPIAEQYLNFLSKLVREILAGDEQRRTDTADDL